MAPASEASHPPADADHGDTRDNFPTRQTARLMTGDTGGRLPYQPLSGGPRWLRANFRNTTGVGDGSVKPLDLPSSRALHRFFGYDQPP